MNFDNDFDDFKLDLFQEEAINYIKKNENVMVCAPTSSGKTLCAIYAMYHHLRQNCRPVTIPSTTTSSIPSTTTSSIIQSTSTLSTTGPSTSTSSVPCTTPTITTPLPEPSSIASINNGKKIIYTSPIKSLSNQKYHEFTQKFKKYGIKIGLITGDIKFNLDANILIMTAEILRNLLYKHTDQIIKLDLNIDVDNDISCVIMDEIHYICNEERGNIWEETLILLPDHINFVLLSATLSHTQIFVDWLNNIKSIPCHLIEKTHRIIPLNHYAYFVQPNMKNLIIDIDNTEIENIQKYSNKLIAIKQHNEKVNFTNYNNIRQLNSTYKDMNSIPFCVNSLCTYLNKNNMLPSLFFVFSRKRIQYFANTLNQSYNTIMEQNQVQKYVYRYIHKLKNKQLYLESYHFLELLELWSKGIAYHHAGLETVYKELIELLCNDKLIKVLFATETFAVGINAPIKTVVFTSLEKYTNDGNNGGYNGSNGGKFRLLNSMEYLQMSGRAGRRNIDDVGNVILLTNVMKNLPLDYEINKMITTKYSSSNYCPNKLYYDHNVNGLLSTTFCSKFRFTYQLLLKIMLNDNKINNAHNPHNAANDNADNDNAANDNAQDDDPNNDKADNDNANKTSKFNEIMLKTFKNSALQHQQQIVNNLKPTIIDVDEYDKYWSIINEQDKYVSESPDDSDAEALFFFMVLSEEQQKFVNHIESLPQFKEDYELYNYNYVQKQKLNQLKQQSLQMFQIESMTKFLVQNEYIDAITQKPTIKGIIAANINEVNEILMTEIIMNDIFDDQLNCAEICAIVSIFLTSKRLHKFNRVHEMEHMGIPEDLKHALCKITELSSECEEKEQKYGLQCTNSRYVGYNINLDMVQYAYLWASQNSLEMLNLDMHLGTFIKDMLRLDNIIMTLEKIFQLINKPKLSVKFAAIHPLIIRDYVNNESLYILQ